MYCVHCPVMEALGLKATGNLGAMHIAAGPPYHGACVFGFYKNPEDIPEAC